jgi:excisionase family DNA binding protein
LVAAAEVAEYLQIHLVTLYRLVRKRQTPAFKIGAEISFHRDAVEKWMTDLQANG